MKYFSNGADFTAANASTELNLCAQAACSDEEKCTCLDVLERGLYMQALARQEGFLAWPSLFERTAAEKSHPGKFDMLEEKAYRLASDGTPPAILHELLLRYLIASRLAGKELFRGLVILRTVLFAQPQAAPHAIYEKERLRSLFGINVQPQLAALFDDAAGKAKEQQRQQWHACCQCKAEAPLCRSDVRNSPAKEFSRLIELVKNIDDHLLKDIFQQTRLPFSSQTVQVELTDPLSAVNWSFVFKHLTDCTVKRKLLHNMSPTVCEAIFEAGQWMGPVKVSDCCYSAEQICQHLTSITKKTAN